MRALKVDLVRLVLGPQGSIQVDLSARLPGRGAYLHRDPVCVSAALRRRALKRALGGDPGPDLESSLFDPTEGLGRAPQAPPLEPTEAKAPSGA